MTLTTADQAIHNQASQPFILCCCATSDLLLDGMLNWSQPKQLWLLDADKPSWVLQACTAAHRALAEGPKSCQASL